MLQMRMEAFAGTDVTHVLVEAPWTHRGVAKPLVFEENKARFARYEIIPRVDHWEPDLAAPWNNEHHQRNMAWEPIGALADDDDIVLICDVDEIPSSELLAFLAADKNVRNVMSVWMRTFLFAVDWEAAGPLPPTCVLGRVSYLRMCAGSGEYIAQIRDKRADYTVFERGGWHFSWLGGPEAQAAKLRTATCHTEIFNTPEAALIESGDRWRHADGGGGIAVAGVDVDDSWPAYITERRCPQNWFRPRNGDLTVTENNAPGR